MVCSNYALCIADRYTRIVKEMLKEGKEVQVKSEIAKALLDSRRKSEHEEGREVIDADSVCKGLERVKETYYRELVNGLKSLGYCVAVVDARLTSKLLVGASGGVFAGLFEVGLAWDLIYDLPFIPASAVKGLLRSWLVTSCAGLGSAGDKRRCLEFVAELVGLSGRMCSGEEECKWFDSVFGGVANSVGGVFAGKMLVFDAYPVRRGGGSVGCGLLDVDVVTPHYYRHGEVVRDEFDAEPKPVVHLSVAPGTVFRFVVAVDSTDDSILDAAGMLLRGKVVSAGVMLASLLVSALTSEGVGARTGKGYGFFELERAEAFSCGSARLRRVARFTRSGKP
jgi:CRISPR-associated protein Cmr6